MQVLFFLTKEDVTPIIKSVEDKLPLKYVEMGLFDSKEAVFYNSAEAINGFAGPSIGNWNKDLMLMIIPNDAALVIRAVEQRKGGIKYAIDPSENQVSIRIQFGGIVSEGVLLAGKCDTIFHSDFSKAVFKEFKATLKTQSRNIDSFYVGRDAESKLKAGWRLVTNEKMASGYDLAYK